MKRYIKIEDGIVTRVVNSLLPLEGYIENKDLSVVKGSTVDKSGVFTPPVSAFNLEKTKMALLQDLGKLLPRKVLGAKKQIIGKPWLTNAELEIQLDIYKAKYEDAKAGLDVFKAQAYKAGVTQEEYRNLIIRKGDEFILAEKKINDLIEAVRQLVEEKIDSIESSADAEKVSEKIKLIDSFTIETPSEEIFKALNQ